MSIQHEGDFLSLNEETLEAVTGGMSSALALRALGRTSSGSIVYHDADKEYLESVALDSGQREVKPAVVAKTPTEHGYIGAKGWKLHRTRA